MRIRWTAYAGVSAALATGVVIKALAQRPNFYSAAVYLAQSNANLMILTNFIFMVACSTLLVFQKVFYGPLRPIEVEQLYEKAWFAVTETCLAMTIFRGEVGAAFLIMFFALLAGKVWGWIGEGRVEILEQQPPANPRLFHTRLMLSLLLSVAFDYAMLDYIIKAVVGMARPDMMVMFGFEFAILTIMSLSTLARYTICLIEIRKVKNQKEKRVEEIRKERKDARDANIRAQAEALAAAATSEEQPTPTTNSMPAYSEPGPDDPIEDVELEVEGWEEKGRYVFYLDLMTDFFKLVIYLSFFFILVVFYGLPIHIMRDVFLTCRSFFKRIADFIKYRTATRDMNERYPDATPEEIGGAENVCIVCREEMRALPPAGPDGAAPVNNPMVERRRPKKLPCGHILHFTCLRSWLEQQQICPTCRRPVVQSAATQARPRGDNAPADQALPGQPAAPGRENQPHRPAAEEQDRARVFQLGPLRIGVGAGRGVVDDMVQQMHNGDARPQQVVNRNNANQYTIGFGFGGGNQQPRRGQRTTIHDQLDQVNRRIRHELEDLQLAAAEMRVVRALQAELERLRNLRLSGNSQGVDLTAISATGTVNHALRQTLVAHPQQNVLQAGSADLPPGLSLPEGWTMMPLHRLEQPLQQTSLQQPLPQFNAVQQPTAQPIVSGSATPNRPIIPVPVQSMFSGQPPNWVNHPIQPREQPASTNGVSGNFSSIQPSQAVSQASSTATMPTTTSSAPPLNANAEPSMTNGISNATAPTPSFSWNFTPQPPQDPPASTSPSQPRSEEQQATESSSRPRERELNMNGNHIPDTNEESPSQAETAAEPSEESSTSKGKKATVEELIEDPD